MKLYCTSTVDSLGRVVLPAELRSQFSIELGKSIDILVDESGIILKAGSLSCTICKTCLDACATNVSGRCVCDKCIDILQKN